MDCSTAGRPTKISRQKTVTRSAASALPFFFLFPLPVKHRPLQRCVSELHTKKSKEQEEKKKKKIITPAQASLDFPLRFFLSFAFLDQLLLMRNSE
jgi:hypothetical protein